MDWTDTCIDRLMGGDSINLVGLDGSGRTRGLRMIAAALNPSDWTSHVWTPSDLASMQRREIRAKIDSLCHSDRIPVLLVDDFGALLMAQNGSWLEGFLFGRAFGSAAGDSPSLRCVVVTHPRDREIDGPGSGLRERAHHMHPPEWTPTTLDMTRFGCRTAEELHLLTGFNSKLIRVGGDTPDARRGAVRSTARRLLPAWIGQLDTDHQNRLERILSRAQPPRWRQDDADPSLTPIVVPNWSENPTRCAITDCMEIDDLGKLLVGQPWPHRDPRAAARRFCARCGSDPKPMWVDNFLSDTDQLDFMRLVEFLQMVLAGLPRATSIRLLSRNWVGGHPVRAAEIATALRQAGCSPDVEKRLHWRLYDKRDVGNLHGRELVLGKRRATFRLPPADIVIGEADTGNETDAPVAFRSSASTFAAWKSGTTVV